MKLCQNVLWIKLHRRNYSNNVQVSNLAPFWSSCLYNRSIYICIPMCNLSGFYFVSDCVTEMLHITQMAGVEVGMDKKLNQYVKLEEPLTNIAKQVTVIVNRNYCMCKCADSKWAFRNFSLAFVIMCYLYRTAEGFTSTSLCHRSWISTMSYNFVINEVFKFWFIDSRLSVHWILADLLPTKIEESLFVKPPQQKKILGSAAVQTSLYNFYAYGWR